jgi:hypothetical protein
MNKDRTTVIERQNTESVPVITDRTVSRGTRHQPSAAQVVGALLVAIVAGLLLGTGTGLLGTNSPTSAPYIVPTATSGPTSSAVPRETVRTSKVTPVPLRMVKPGDVTTETPITTPTMTEITTDTPTVTPTTADTPTDVLTTAQPIEETPTQSATPIPTPTSRPHP